MLVFGLGYSGTAIAKEAMERGMTVMAAMRDPARPVPAGVQPIAFGDSEQAIAQATHLVITAPPPREGAVAGVDPVWAAHGAALQAARRLAWVGYISTTGVYGDRQGGRVTEATPAAPGQARSQRRLEAEQAWETLADRAAVDIFRTGGIYGPGRSPFDDLRAGRARRVIKPGHLFGRIHRDDIAQAVVAAALALPGPGRRVFNLVDDRPDEQAVVVAEAARMLGMEPPPGLPFEEALVGMSPMGRSFWAENRVVDNQATKVALGITWRYPSWVEGLKSILADETPC